MCERCGCGSVEIVAHRSTAQDELVQPWRAAEAGAGGAGCAAQPCSRELGAAAALALASASVSPLFLISAHSAVTVSLLPQRAPHGARWVSVAETSRAHRWCWGHLWGLASSAEGQEPAEAT